MDGKTKTTRFSLAREKLKRSASPECGSSRYKPPRSCNVDWNRILRHSHNTFKAVARVVQRHERSTSRIRPAPGMERPGHPNDELRTASLRYDSSAYQTFLDLSRPIRGLFQHNAPPLPLRTGLPSTGKHTPGWCIACVFVCPHPPIVTWPRPRI